MQPSDVGMTGPRSERPVMSMRDVVALTVLLPLYVKAMMDLGNAGVPGAFEEVVNDAYEGANTALAVRDQRRREFFESRAQAELADDVGNRAE